MMSRQGRLVAIKIAVARMKTTRAAREHSIHQILNKFRNNQQHIVSLEDSFEIRGPNGKHTCLVFQPMGPHIGQYLLRKPEFQYGEFF